MTEWKVIFHDRFKRRDHRLSSRCLGRVARASGAAPREGLPTGTTRGRHARRLQTREHEELRVKVLKVQWRFAFAFDPERKAVVLCGAAKSGVSQKLFYKRLIVRRAFERVGEVTWMISIS